MLLKSTGKEDEEEEDERAGSPQLEADLAFEVVLEVANTRSDLFAKMFVSAGLELKVGSGARSQNKKCHC